MPLRVWFLLVFGVVAQACGVDSIPLDLAHPPEADPKTTYKLTVNVGKGIGPVELFVSVPDAGSLVIKQVGFEDIELGPEHASLGRIEIADYNLDGRQDFRVLIWHGTGGSGYEYFRFEKGRYIRWKEPTELEISSVDFGKALAFAGGHSGPAYNTRTYKISDGRFLLISREIYDRADSLRDSKEWAKLVPKNVPKQQYVRIEEKIRRGSVIERRIFKQNPWQDESEAVILSTWERR